METAFGYKTAADSESGVRADDRWHEAHTSKNERKKTPRKAGGRTDQRDAMIRSAAKQSSGLSTAVICPDCLQVYSRGYISRHRRGAHDVINTPGTQLNYVPVAGNTTDSRVRFICPDCGNAFTRGSMSRHRWAIHGTKALRHVSAGYQRA